MSYKFSLTCMGLGLAFLAAGSALKVKVQEQEQQELKETLKEAIHEQAPRNIKEAKLQEMKDFIKEKDPQKYIYNLKANEGKGASYNEWAATFKTVEDSIKKQDSLMIEAKCKAAYYEGIKHATDSINNLKKVKIVK